MPETVAQLWMSLLSGALPALAQQDRQWRHMHDWMGWETGWGGMILGPLFMIAWAAVLVGVVVLVLRWLGAGAPPATHPTRTARELLDERYARGDIDREEYIRRRDDMDRR